MENKTLLMDYEACEKINSAYIASTKSRLLIEHISDYINDTSEKFFEYQKGNILMYVDILWDYISRTDDILNYVNDNSAVIKKAPVTDQSAKGQKENSN